jgi:hypothetical protein
MGTMVCSLTKLNDLVCRLFPDLQHVIVDANHLWQGFISSTEDPELSFKDVSKDTLKDILNESETLFSDAILVSLFSYSLINETRPGSIKSTDAMSCGSELMYSSSQL